MKILIGSLMLLCLIIFIFAIIYGSIVLKITLNSIIRITNKEKKCIAFLDALFRQKKKINPDLTHEEFINEFVDVIKKKGL